MTAPEGGFYSAQDADSGGEEGRYYLWTKEEICAVLGDQDGERFCTWYAIPSQGRWLPHLLYEPQYDQAWRRISGQCRALAQARRARGLHRDDKVLTAWNAMMIAALAKASRVLGEERYLSAARDARLFLKTRLTQPDGRLWLRWRDREPALEGQLDDYAFYCWALTELYEADFSTSCLREAAELADRMASLFRDESGGGLYRTAAEGERLIVRQKDAFDAGIPSGAGAAGLALVKLARLTGQERFRRMAEEQLAWLAGAAQDDPAGCCFALLAVMEELYPRRELAYVSEKTPPRWLAGAGEAYRLAVLAKTPENERALANLSPRSAGYPVPRDGERFYLCREGACLPPAESLERLRELLQEEAVGSRR